MFFCLWTEKYIYALFVWDSAKILHTKTTTALYRRSWKRLQELHMYMYMNEYMYDTYVHILVYERIFPDVDRINVLSKIFFTSALF